MKIRQPPATQTPKNWESKLLNRRPYSKNSYHHRQARIQNYQNPAKLHQPDSKIKVLTKEEAKATITI